MSELISVIVPVYNVEDYLPKCIDSILSQRYQNLEIILVNDGSTDHSLEICKEYAGKDDRIVLISKLNGGLSSARNAALDVCKGDYIAFVDSDDWILPDMFSSMLEACKNADADLAICGIGTEHPPIIKKYPVASKKKVLGTEELMFSYLTAADVRQVVWNKLYRAHFFERHRFKEGVIYEDAFIMHELLSQCRRAVFVDDCFYIQLIRPGSITQSKFSQKNLDAVQAYSGLIGFLSEHYPRFTYLGESKKINSYLSLMKLIVCGKQTKQYRDVFDSLYADFCKDYSAFCEQKYDRSYIYPEAKTAIRSKSLYIRKAAAQHNYRMVRNRFWNLISRAGRK